MKQVFRILAYFLPCCLPYQLFSQFNYTFSAVAGTFTANASPTTVFFTGDDNVFSAPITLGSAPAFVFKFGCTNYTEVVITDNGMFTFDPTCTTFHNVNNLNSQAVDRPIVAPLWDDLAVDFTTGNVNYKLTGVAPNRVFTIEWKQMLWGWMATTWAISVQAKLYETTNVIEFIYNRNGTATANLNSPSASIGLGGATVGQYYSLNGTGASPSALTSPETTTLNSKPATGQIYRWTPVCALPIALIDFHGETVDGKNVLFWTTASEENNDYFTLERSVDAINFEQVARIQGANNSNVELHYSQSDPNTSDLPMYYRLKQTDNNGGFAYSEIVFVHSDKTNSISIYPNPASEYIQVKGIGSTIPYSLMNASGVIVQSGTITQTNAHINLQQIPPGIYYLEINHQFNKLIVD